MTADGTTSVRTERREAWNVLFGGQNGRKEIKVGVSLPPLLFFLPPQLTFSQRRQSPQRRRMLPNAAFLCVAEEKKREADAKYKHEVR